MRIARVLAPALALNLALLVSPAAAIGRLPAILGDPASAAFLAIASALVLADAPTIGRRIAIDREGNPGHRRSRNLAAWTGCVILAVFWASLLERSAHAGDPIGRLQVIGGAGMLAGVALRAAAVRSLGNAFITEPAHGPLIILGIHARIRHPSEAGNLAAAFGAACLLGSFAGLAIALLGLLPLVLHRIRIEDRHLLEQHGEAFEVYRSRVGSLLPRARGRSPAASSAGGAIGRAASLRGGSGETGACGRAIRGSGWVD